MFVVGQRKDIEYEDGGWNSGENFDGSRYQRHIPLGNIFDDLKRNREDLREFRDGDVRIKINDEAVKFSVDGWRDDHDGLPLPLEETRSWNLTQEGAVMFHQKLGQIIATIKREQNND